MSGIHQRHQSVSAPRPPLAPKLPKPPTAKKPLWYERPAVFDKDKHRVPPVGATPTVTKKRAHRSRTRRSRPRDSLQLPSNPPKSTKYHLSAFGLGLPATISASPQTLFPPLTGILPVPTVFTPTSTMANVNPPTPSEGAQAGSFKTFPATSMLTTPVVESVGANWWSGSTNGLIGISSQGPQSYMQNTHILSLYPRSQFLFATSPTGVIVVDTANGTESIVASFDTPGIADATCSSSPYVDNTSVVTCVAVGHGDSVVTLWDVAQCSAIGAVEHQSPFKPVESVSMNGPLLTAVDEDGFKIWDTRNNSNVFCKKVTACKWQSHAWLDGNRLLVGGSGGEIMLNDMRTMTNNPSSPRDHVQWRNEVGGNIIDIVPLAGRINGFVTAGSGGCGATAWVWRDPSDLTPEPHPFNLPQSTPTIRAGLSANGNVIVSQLPLNIASEIRIE